MSTVKMYRLLGCLSFILIFTGQASLPMGQVTTPPTPAQNDYADWSFHQVKPTYQVDQKNQPQSKNGPEGQPCEMNPSKDNYTGVVFSGTGSDTNWNEDIYYLVGPCIYNFPQRDIRLNSDPGADFEPRLGKNAASIVFVSDRNSIGNTVIDNIYTMDTNGANQHRLTTTSAHDRMPAFSSDNSKIVFVSDRSGNAEIYTMNSDGSGVTQITNSAEIDVEPDWSPDGMKIAWIRRLPNNTGVLSLMNPDGTDKTALLAPLPYIGHPVWSPSGKQLAFRLDSDNDGWYELAIVRADGSGFKVIKEADGKTSDLEMGGWLPDDSGIIYDEIGYVLYGGNWYIKSAFLQRYNFTTMNGNGFLYSLAGYAFTPHVRSLDETKPIVGVDRLPEFSPASGFEITWSVLDKESGPYGGSLEVKSENKPYGEIIDGITSIGLPHLVVRSTSYFGRPGDTASFRVAAVDKANNNHPYNDNPDAWTRLYQWMAQIQIMDTHDHPLPDVQVQLTPNAMNQATTMPDGQAQFYFPVTGNYTVTYYKTGYAAPLPQKWIMDSDKQFVTVLTGSQELVQNGHFEDPQNPLVGWESTGDFPVGSTNGRVSGQSAQLKSLCPDQSCSGWLSTSGASALTQTITIPETMSAPTLSFFYRIASSNITPQSHFEVIFTPTNGQPISLMTKASKNSNWAHAWFDLSPFVGQTGALTFRNEQKQGELPVNIYLDEVSISTWPTPTLYQLNPNQVAYPLLSDTWIDLFGENLQQGALIFLGDNQISPTEWIDSSHMRFLFSSNQTFGIYSVKIINPNGGESQLPFYAGNFLYLPRIGR